MCITCFRAPEEENGYLSNGYLSCFSLDGKHYSSMEQYIEFSRKCIRDDTVWRGCLQIIIYRGLMAKFTQNPELKKKLLSTGESVIAYCRINDRILGIGLGLNDNERLQMGKWLGYNLLGFALMEVRETMG